MVKIIRQDYYFSNLGPENTDDVIEAVIKRVSETKIKYIVVASHSEEIALRFAEALKGKAKIICVSAEPARRRKGKEWPTIKSKTRKKLIDLGVIIVDRARIAMPRIKKFW